MTEPRKRGRPRSAETDLRIHAAALEILRNEGPARVTMEAVASGSGVAKTTIYRRYPDRDALLRAALGQVIGTPEEPPVEDAREKVAWALGQAWRQMADVLGAGGLAAVIGNSDPDFADLFHAALAPYHEALVALISADVAAGRLRNDLDADTAVSLFVGGYLGELVRRGSVSDDFFDRCLDLMWTAMARR